MLKTAFQTCESLVWWDDVGNFYGLLIGGILKRTFRLAIATTSALILVGCASPGIEVPDLTNTDENSVSTFLLNQDLLPEIVYENSDGVEDGLVIRTQPPAGEVVSTGTKVKVFVSSGPRRIEANNSNMEWTYVGYGADDWNFNSPYIDNGILTIETTDVKFGTALEWRKGDSSGEGFGRAAINDKFDKAVPISFEFEKKKVSAGEKQDLKLLIPTGDLDNKKPTTLHLELYAKVGGQNRDVKINFTITW